jgi:hypothetical protein
MVQDNFVSVHWQKLFCYKLNSDYAAIQMIHSPVHEKMNSDCKQQSTVATECIYNFNIFTVLNAFTARWLNNVLDQMIL